MNSKIQNRLARLEAMADMFKEHVTVLKKELEGSGASKSSARKGKEVLSEKQKAVALAEFRRKRMKKATGKSGSKQ